MNATKEQYKERMKAIYRKVAATSFLVLSPEEMTITPAPKKPGNTKKER
ncbi:hypothetical protein ACFL38_04965 [Candidatus Omnitrophota bacterium]